MGTSSSHGGPKGHNPLLPKDFVDPDKDTPNWNEDRNSNENSDPDLLLCNPNLWQNAKTQTSYFLNGSVSNIKTPFAAYVKAYGGAKGASKTAITAKQTTQTLGGFLSSLSSSGIKSILNNLKIDFQNRNIRDVLSDLGNSLSSNFSTKEDGCARNALFDAIGRLYAEISLKGGDIEVLDHLNAETFNEVMNVFISSYIFQRFLKDLESRFEESSNNIDRILHLENMFNEYIKGVVKNSTNGVNFAELDYQSKSIAVTIDVIYKKCYDVLAGFV